MSEAKERAAQALAQARGPTDISAVAGGEPASLTIIGAGQPLRIGDALAISKATGTGFIRVRRRRKKRPH